MIADAARLLNAKLALDPLVVEAGAAEPGTPPHCFLAEFDEFLHTVTRAVNSLLYTGPRLSGANCHAAANMAEKLLSTAHLALDSPFLPLRPEGHTP